MRIGVVALDPDGAVLHLWPDPPAFVDADGKFCFRLESDEIHGEIAAFQMMVGETPIGPASDLPWQNVEWGQHVEVNWPVRIS